ncbi:MAG: DUF1993 domain-containing protein [Proteobacteria bacterium]|nr:DUF1993 domain-containing protein [Pseudomonadota bacterium]MCP4917480.1 DUF1993 domain-containing protein [Pseudomonadota bacterium]
MSMYNATVPQFTQLLDNLSGWLVEAEAYAEARGFDVAVLLDQRLYPDMFSLRRQIQSSCDNVKLCCTRLGDVEAPKHEDGEQTWDELKARLAEVRAFIQGLDPEGFSDAAKRELTPGFLRGRAVLGHHYLNQFALPNLYFHLSMTYAILRSNGVQLGKMKFIGNLTTYEPTA